MREVEGVIERIGGQGDGVMATPQGPLYVPYTVPGDRVMVRVGRAQGDGFSAMLREVIAPGPDRVEPRCPHFHACGGCALQQLSIAAYTAWKRDKVCRALVRQGFEPGVVGPLAPCRPGARRRADFAARRVGAAILLGFHEAASKRIIDVEVCPVLDPRLVAFMAPLRLALAPLLAVGQAVDIRVTLTDAGLDVAIAGDLKLGAADRARLAAFASAEDLARLSAGDAAGGNIDDIVRRRTPVLHFGGVAVDLPHGGFVQASAAAETALVEATLQWLAEARSIVDLFAGAGTFAFPLAVAGKRVHAADGAAPAIGALQAAANRAGLSRVSSETRDLARRPFAANELDRFDAAVFNPPRAGAKEQAEALARAKLARVVGVSCNPASFARDARILAAGGFRLERVLPVDQFLWSAEVELAGLFSR
jgi:23S rRNA (uracil1939-C5)-methyltransferase